MKKLLILSSIFFTFILCGCKTNQSIVEAVPPKTSPIVTFADFVDQSKCELVAEDDIVLTIGNHKLHAFILNVKNPKNIYNIYECISGLHGETAKNLETWGFYLAHGISGSKHFYLPGDDSYIVMNNELVSKDKITVVVLANIQGENVVADHNTFFLSSEPNKYLTSANEEFDLTKIEGIYFRFLSFIPLLNVPKSELGLTEATYGFTKSSK